LAEIRNYTMNFSSGRAALPRLTPAARALAFTEVHGERALECRFE
jgi:hypothetical protein